MCTSTLKHVVDITADEIDKQLTACFHEATAAAGCSTLKTDEHKQEVQLKKIHMFYVYRTRYFPVN